MTTNRRTGRWVWGSGLAEAAHAARVKRVGDVRVLAVRGPLTRAALIEQGVACPAVYGDPACLLPELVVNDVEPRHAVGLVPHFLDYPRVAQDYRRRRPDPAVKLINVTRPYAEVVRDILACETVLASSLHGLIVAEAYGIPARLWTRGDEVEFKYRDYYAATGREPDAVRYDGLDHLVRQATAGRSVAARFDAEPLLVSLGGQLGSLRKGPLATWKTWSVRAQRRGDVTA